jgi:hypothetical protein
MATTDTHATVEELLERVPSVRSLPRLYNMLARRGGKSYDLSSDYTAVVAGASNNRALTAVLSMK